MLQKLKVRIKGPIYHFQGPFGWAQHHQIVHVSTNNLLRIVTSKLIAQSPSKSYFA
jgi:hypothetical protein